MITPQELTQLVNELKAENEQANQAIDDEMEAYLATSLKPQDLTRIRTNYDELARICEQENDDAFRIFEENILASKELEVEKQKLFDKLELSRSVLSSLLATKVS